LTCNRQILAALIGAFLFVSTPLSAQSLPNGFPTVQAVFATGQFTIDNHDGQSAFTDAVVCALNRVDNRWGNLRKNPGQTNIHGHAEDSVLYKYDDGVAQSVDFIGGAGALGARPQWLPDIPRYTTADWSAPHNCGTVPPVEIPPTTPPTVPVVDLSAVVASLARLEAALASVQNQLSSANEGLRNLSDRQEILISRPFPVAPVYKGSVLGFAVTLRPSNP
jgi:hypothetical protein